MKQSARHPLLEFFEIIGGNIPPEFEGHAICLGVSLGQGTKWGCPVCRNPNVPLHRDYPNARVTLDVDEAKFFPDSVLGIGRMIISEKMHSDLIEAGMTGFIAHSVPFSFAAGFRTPFRKREIPPYYLLEITGRIDIDRKRFDNFEGQLCAACGHWKPTPGSACDWGEKTLLPAMDSWNGGDIMIQRNINSGVMHCSRRLADLAAIKKWTGFGIKVMSWGCRGGGNADLSDPNWFEDLSARVHEAYPIVDGIIKSPVVELAIKKTQGVAWPFPPPVE